jgi:Flp pilus assembly protein TadD
MAAALLAGCAGQTPFADSARTPASSQPGEGAADAIVAKAEKGVARSPGSASARAELAQAYLTAGRFDSAATTFEDAVALGGDNARIGLGMALAYIGAGRNAEAFAVLGRWRDQIPASDFGLAVALAGQPAMGVAVLTDTVRGGNGDAKARQNLAYAYALNGQWVQARLIASQDVPADQLDARLAEWAAKARPEASRQRVAGLIGAPLRADPGQPAALALGGRVDEARLAQAEIPAPAHELPPVGTGEDMASADVPARLASPFAVTAPEPAPEPSAAFISRPVVGKVAKGESTFGATFDRMTVEKIAPTAKTKPNPKPAGGTHLVQLGSFQSREGAERAWGIFVKRDPSLKHHTMRITEAEVNGGRYYRVAAEGFDRASAHSMCASVKSRGQGCLAYSERTSLPGTVPSRGAGASLRAR